MPTKLQKIIDKYKVVWPIECQLLVYISMHWWWDVYCGTENLKEYFEDCDWSFYSWDYWMDYKNSTCDESIHYAYVNNIWLDYEDALYLYKYFISQYIKSTDSD